MSARFGAMRGEEINNAKLTDDDVRLLRACAEERARLTLAVADRMAELERITREVEDLRRQRAEISNAMLAEKFGVTRATVLRVVNRETWRHVD